MDSHAQRARQGIAMTEVALKVFDALEYAWSEKALVQITGDSRFGKTEAVKTWCMMHPGTRPACHNAIFQRRGGLIPRRGGRPWH